MVVGDCAGPTIVHTNDSSPLDTVSLANFNVVNVVFCAIFHGSKFATTLKLYVPFAKLLMVLVAVGAITVSISVDPL